MHGKALRGLLILLFKVTVKYSLFLEYRVCICALLLDWLSFSYLGIAFYLTVQYSNHQYGLTKFILSAPHFFKLVRMQFVAHMITQITFSSFVSQSNVLGSLLPLSLLLTIKRHPFNHQKTFRSSIYVPYKQMYLFFGNFFLISNFSTTRLRTQ